MDARKEKERAAPNLNTIAAGTLVDFLEDYMYPPRQHHNVEYRRVFLASDRGI